MVDAASAPNRDSFEIARGAHVGIVKPDEGFQPRVSITWPNFKTLVSTFAVSDSKVGEYICRPMGGDGARSDGNALAWPVMPIDIDEILPEEVLELEKWCARQGLELVLATTFSHTLENPRLRLWIHCSRPFTAQEHPFLFRAFNQGAVFPFKLDPATAKPSQPIYLPRCPSERQSIAFAKYFAGAPLDVDGLIQIYKREMRERAQRNEAGRFQEKGSGVRAPGGMIDTFNKRFSLPELLEAHGYKKRTNNRYIAPRSKSGRAAVVLYEFGLISFHEPDHDPLAQTNALMQHRILDPFAVYAILEHQDEFIPAFKEAAKIVRQRGWEEEVKVSDIPIWFQVQKSKEAVDDLKPKEMLVKGVLEERSIVIARGPSNSGKTTICQAMAFCIATGQDFGSHLVKQGRVLWIAGEDSYNARLRIAGMCQEYSYSLDDLNEQLIIIPQAISVLDKASMEALHTAIEAKLGIGVSFAAIFADTKDANWGGEDENSNSENSAFIRALQREIVEHYRAACIVLHHETKHKDREERTARGASALINNADHEWIFDQNLNAAIATMEPGKVRIARWPPMRFRIKVIELDKAKFSHLINSDGDMPQISVAEMVNAYGVNMQQQQEDFELASVLQVFTVQKVTYKKANISVATALGKISAGSTSTPEHRSATDWARNRIKKLVEQKLLVVDEKKKEYSVPQAGRDFIEQVMSGVAVSGEPEIEKTDGNDNTSEAESDS